MEDAHNAPQRVAKAAQESLRQLVRQQAELARRIRTLKRTIVGLARLFGDDLLNDELCELVGRRGAGRQPGCAAACPAIVVQGGYACSAPEACELDPATLSTGCSHNF